MRLFRIVCLFALLFGTSPALAEVQTEPVEWNIDDTTFSGVLVYDDSSTKLRPGLVMVPNWMGVNAATIEQARVVAGDDYVVLVADVYGKQARPQNSEQALVQVKKVYADGGKQLRARVAKAVEVLRAQADTAPLKPDAIGAIGFCFGGGAVLELARSGSGVAGVVSFHGGLETHLPTESNTIDTSVLVLHGADDRGVSDEAIVAFKQEMDAADADWQFVAFSDTAHCFTQPQSNNPPNCVYNARSTARAYEMMRDFFGERFAAE